MRLAGTNAVSWPALRKVVANGVPPALVGGGIGMPAHFTTEPAKKPEPDTVTVKEAPPALTWFGLADTIVGGVRTLVLTLVLRQLDVIPPEFTETVALSVTPHSPAGTSAVTCVALTIEALKGEPFQLRVEFN